MAAQGTGDMSHLKSFYPGWGLVGEELHSEAGVTPDKWCITRADLQFLRQQIQQAVREKRITPTERDPFDTKDDTTGPNMYNVVNSFIIPLTLAAGKMSWALLRNPAGLPCDIFITHWWEEGAYEFIDKVLASWPSGKHAAWCCILANPQNLDISHLLREPLTSPFALALKQASHVMVVPTRWSSIYTRIWCVYEAYLAVTWRKTVFTARTKLPLGRYLVVPVCIAVWVAWAEITLKFEHESHRIVSYCTFGAVIVILVIRMGYSRVTRMQAEADDLRLNFTCVTEAAASKPEDKNRIMQEIGDDAEKVNDVVKLLQEIGMFTPALHSAMELGVNLQGVGVPVFPRFWMLAWFIISYWNYARHRVFGAIQVICVIFIMWQFRQQGIDGKAFIRSLTITFSHVAILITLAVEGLRSFWAAAEHLYVVATLAVLAGALFAWMGPSRLAKVPYVGVALAEVLWTGYWAYCNFKGVK